MSEGALPSWHIEFDKAGRCDAGARTVLIGQIAGSGVTDLIVMSHGWNNNVVKATALYQRWFGMLPSLLRDGMQDTVGTLGIFWPSMLWPDDAPPPADGGAAALVTPTLATPAESVMALEDVYRLSDQQEILTKLAALLDARSDDPKAPDEFRSLMAELVATEDPSMSFEDNGPSNLLGRESTQELADRFADALDCARSEAQRMGLPDWGGSDDYDDGGAANFATNMVSRTWDGLKEALRQLTYWQMKARAGTVGKQGLGPFLDALQRDSPGVRVHLVGHSFGARLVSFALAGLPPETTSPVASLTLLEGAFSHFAFAPVLPEGMSSGGGALKGMTARVSGPLLACYSDHDLALAIFYPTASRITGDDRTDLVSDLTYQWGGMGHDGAQKMEAKEISLGDTTTIYDLTTGAFTNIDCSAVVRAGRPPAGAHSDIFHPELARAMLSGAGLV